MSSGQVWPDGTFGISILEKRELKVELQEASDLSTDEQTFRRSCALHGLIPSLEVWGKAVNCMDVLSQIAESYPDGKLGLSRVPNSHRQPRGQNGISSNARMTVKNAALLLQKKWKKEHLSFLTLTLPTTTPEDNQRITELWPNMVRTFVQWLGRNLRSHGLDGEVVGCVEIQEKRSSWQHGILGLHLHLVFRGRRPREGWVMKAEQFREGWKRTIINALGPSSEGYYYGAVENVERVKYDAARYLGKYLSKGSKAILRFRALFPHHRLPSCWSVCTLTLRAAVKNCKMAGPATAGQLKTLIYSGRAECFERLMTATITLPNGKEVLCGWYGTLSDEGRRVIGIDRHVKLRLGSLATAGD